MHPIKLLVTANLQFLQDCYSRLTANFDCTYAHGANGRDVSELLKDKKAWFCSPCPEYFIDRGVLSNATVLKLIATPSTGITHIDKSYCDDNEIEIATLRDTEAINTIYASSEHTFALILAAARNLVPAVIGANKGEWRENEDKNRGIELHGKTLGVIGYGRIGSNVARYAKSFGMKVVVMDPYVQVRQKDGIAQVHELQTLLNQADIVAVCVHLKEDTKEMIDSKVFSQMRDGAIFINTARGELVDESALVAALESGKLSSAAIDVMTNEQSPDRINSPLIRYSQSNSNLTISPHIAGLTIDSERKAAEQSVRNLNSYFKL